MDQTVLLGYIDPVSGTILLQTILAAVAGVGVAFRSSIQWRILQLVRFQGTLADVSPSAVATDQSASAIPAPAGSSLPSTSLPC